MLFTGRLFIIKDSLHTISVYPACEARGRKEFRMNIFSLFTLCGGLAFFLYGMTVMSKSLEKMAGGKLEKLLKRMTSNPIKSLLLGAGITIAIQSSSALTVMLVGLVNSGIMELSQTIGVLMGSNIGTTLTAWILSLSGIEGDNPFLRMLKPESFSPIIALIGVIMIMTAKHNRTKDIGKIMVGFSVLMTGMTLMSGAVSPLADSPQFSHILTAFRNPIMGVLVGAVFTGVIQSSAASVGILQALSLTGQVTYGMAIPIIMGQNIGTCVTALLSSIGVNRSAKRVACVHICFNCIGTLIILPVFYGLYWLLDFAFVASSIDPAGVALVHTIFNIVTTAMLLPFTKLLEKLAYTLVRDSKKEKEAKEKHAMLDERLLATPAVAIEVCHGVTIEMGELSKKTMELAIGMLFQYDKDIEEQIKENENRIDKYEDKLNAYLVRISKHSISSKDNRTVSKMLHCIGNFERIGDHAVNIMESAHELHEKGLHFSGDAAKELRTLCDALLETLDLAFQAFEKDDLAIAHQVEPLEEVIDTLNLELKNRHIKRLQNEECTVELGYIYQDLLTNIERISDHCSNIAGVLIEIDEKQNIHKYLYKLKETDETFQESYHEYLNHYYLELGQPSLDEVIDA